MIAMLEHFHTLDAALVAKEVKPGITPFPPTSPWWLAAVTRFYESGRRTWVLRVGRRGGKSSTLCRVAVVEGLYGDHQVPLGDVGYVAIISVDREEASRRLRTIRAILDAIGVAYEPRGQTLEVVRPDGKPIVFAVFTASVAGVSGPTVIFAFCDEVAKWRDVDSGANPAKEVLASLRPTLATMPNAKLVLSSSPMGFDDAHAKAFAQGDTMGQLIAFAPTWIANPTIDEAGTRGLEPDDRVWRREFAAIPQAGALAAFDLDAIDRAFAHPNIASVRSTPIVVIDASSGGSDSFTWGAANVCRSPSSRWKTYRHYETHASYQDGAWGGRWITRIARDNVGKPVPNPDWLPGSERWFLRFGNWAAIDGGFWGKVSFDDVVDEIARLARHVGARLVVGDQREAYALTSAFATRGIRYVPITWTDGDVAHVTPDGRHVVSKTKAVGVVRDWMRDGMLSLGENEKLRSELLAFEEKITPSGQFTFAARGHKHDDRVALLVSAACAFLLGLVPNAPTSVRRWIPSHLHA